MSNNDSVFWRAFFATFLGVVGARMINDKVIRRMSYPIPDLPDIKLGKIDAPEIIFGDYNESCIVPGNTNKNLMAKYGGQPQLSGYVRTANDKARQFFKKLNTDVPIKIVDYNDKNLQIEKYKNILVLGGPVASDLTMALCGYENRDIRQEHRKDKAKIIPVFNDSLPYPSYFNVGNEKDGYEVICILKYLT